ncbi:MAG: KilA-N domain-containing protein [Nostoc sp. DedQUE08]|uniref:KilA-N domain-containing protein n=1 Tax=unclassified Nostoc TaxID=2593658 RepID=UPI002AD522FC|nr:MULTISPECIES: KilA-N domain-containing protein [unclassified Nostoc]MDZ8069604.1 KilA-N domain-containing protein [Nostoc sp. DedQUE08]MDZ8140650.1 KilA-N domain-containing protein [Nostoc sp. DedQUE04]
MSNIEQFGNLVQDAQRDDNYINATKWCKRFGYDLKNWKRFPETKARFEHLKNTQSNAEPWIVERVGKTWVTWVHPIMAVHLASYLDPAFANYVAETFIRYAEADPTLAADIASRQNTVEGLDIINEAVQKQYSFIYKRDFICFTNPIALDRFRKQPEWGEKLSESNLVSLLNKKFGLPCEKLVFSIPLCQDTFDLLEDFLKEKYPNIYQSAYTFFERHRRLDSGISVKLDSSISIEDEIALFSYFILEIRDWVREKGGAYNF